MTEQLTHLMMGLDPAEMMRAAGLPPDPWQADVMRSEADRLLLLCSRQTGKSSTTACMALHRAIFHEDSLILCLSPSLRQSGELFNKIALFDDRLGRPAGRERTTYTTVEMSNGSRVISLPGTHETVRGYSGVDLLIIDEAAQTADDLYMSCLPMLAVSRGRLVALSTPFGRRGWFHSAWHDAGAAWERVKVVAEQCPRIAPSFLAEQRTLLGPHWYMQEFECVFADTIDQVFDSETIDRAFCSARPPLFGEPAAEGGDSARRPLFQGATP